MTFEEWWEKTEKDEEIKNREVIYKNLAELLAHDAWKTAQKQQFVSDESAQPKWTYCKDEMPKNGEKVIALNFIKEMYICNYYSLPKKCNWTCMGVDIENVIAWMPLPEATGNIDK